MNALFFKLSPFLPQAHRGAPASIIYEQCLMFIGALIWSTSLFQPKKRRHQNIPAHDIDFMLVILIQHKLSNMHESVVMSVKCVDVRVSDHGAHSRGVILHQNVHARDLELLKYIMVQ